MEESEHFTDGCLVCGNCCAKFHSPQELAAHCFQCFENGKLRMKDTGLQDKENALVNKGCDVIRSIVPENSYTQHAEGSYLQLNSMQHMLNEDYYSFFSNQGEDSSYQCKICGKVFTNYGSYRRHLRMHITGKSHACGDCGKRYFRRYLLIQHQEKAHGGTRQSIRLCHCGTWFKDPESLKLHSQKVHSKEPLQGCGLPLQRLRYSRKNNPELKYPESESVTDVQINTINEREIIEIKHASETLGQADHLVYQSKELRTKPFPEENDPCWLCTICSWPLRNREEVLAHRQVCYPMVDYGLSRKKKNVDNSLIFNDQQNFKSMVSNQLAQEEFPCDLSVKQNDMPKINAKSPPRRGSFLCETCHKTFINRSSFLRHRRMHTGVKPCVCEFCCMSFFRSESLATHQRKHGSKTDYICYKCGYQANDAFSLREHFTCHTESDIHIEQIQSNKGEQEMNAGNKVVFQIHGSAHSSEDDSNSSLLKEETPAGYCKICQKTYYKVDNYSRHMKLHKNSFHATQWFTCTFCGKVSSSRKDHQDHLKEHSLAAYSCVKCDMRFHDKETFSTHVIECMEGWDKSTVAENEQCNSSKQIDNLEVSRNDTETKIFTKNSSTLNKMSWISKNNTVMMKQTTVNSENVHEEGNVFLTDRLKIVSETFTCKVCSQKFESHGSFRKHMQMHKGNWIRSCKYCGKYFFRKDHLHYHESTRHFGMEKNGDIFCCFYCSICYPSSASLKEHVASSHKVSSLLQQQSFCDESPNSSNEAVSKADDYCHLSSPYLCNSDSEGENPKLSRSTRNTPIDYSNKNTEFLEDNALNDTLYMRDDNTSKQIKETEASSKIELTKTDGKGFSCGRCSIVFQNTTEMLTHLQETHGLHRTDGDNNIDGLTTDEKAKLRKSQGSYKQCSRCQRQFSTHNSLLSHLCTKTANSVLQENTVSKQNQKHVCNMCLQEFPEIHMLDAHKQLAHVIMDMYECIVCRHKGSKEVIHAHMLSHMLKCGTFVTTVHTYQHDQEEQIKAQAKAKESFNMWDLSQNNEPELQYQQLGFQNVQRTEVIKDQLQSQELPRFENNTEDAFSNNWDGRNNYKKPQDGVSPMWMNEQTINSHSVSQYPSSDVEEITVEPSLDILAIAATENGECENFSYNEETEGNDITMYSDNTDEVPSPHLPKRPRAIVLYQRGKKIYKCEECDRVFINYSSCKRHRRQHSGVWKHECNICGRVFFRKDQRDKHLKSHSVAKSSPD